MRLPGRAVLWALCAALLAGCGDRLSEPEVPPDPLAARMVDRPAPGKKPYGCFISVATPNGPFKYRYREIPFRFARPAVDAAEGLYRLFRYRRYNRGELLWLANCLIPYSDEAIQAATDRFDFRRGKRKHAQQASLLPLGAVKRAFNLLGAAIVQLWCGDIDAGQDPCPIDPIVVECDEHPGPECEEDEPPGGGEFPEPPDDGPPGGDPPCYPCLPGGGGTDPGGENATAKLECRPPTVVRSSETSCEITVDPPTTPLEVLRWRFQGSGSGLDGLYQSTSRTFDPSMAVSGTIFADIVMGADTGWAFDQVTVDPRVWPWDSTGWRIEANTMPALCWSASEPVQGNPGKVRSAACTVDFVQPWHRNGATLAQTNMGIYYVQSSTFRVEALSGLHPELLESSTKTYSPVDPAQANACRSALNLGPSDPVSINHYTFNDRCKPTPFYNTYLAGIDAHERNHLRRAVTAGRKSENNILEQVELLVELDPTAIRDQIEQIWTRVNDRVRADIHFPDDPYIYIADPGDIYIWDPATSTFKLTERRYPV